MIVNNDFCEFCKFCKEFNPVMDTEKWTYINADNGIDINGSDCFEIKLFCANQESCNEMRKFMRGDSK